MSNPDVGTCSACGAELHRNRGTGAVEDVNNRLHRHPVVWRVLARKSVTRAVVKEERL